MTPHAVNWRRDYYYTAMGTEGTRALIGPSEDDSIGGDGVESNSTESDNAKDNSAEDNVNDEDGCVDSVSPEDDTDRHNGWHALSGTIIPEGGEWLVQGQRHRKNRQPKNQSIKPRGCGLHPRLHQERGAHIHGNSPTKWEEYVE